MRALLVLMILVLPPASAQVLFEDPAGDGGLGPDLRQARVVHDVEGADLTLSYDAGPQDANIVVTWDVIDFFGTVATRQGVEMDLSAQQAWSIDADGETIQDLEADFADGVVTVYRVPLDGAPRGIGYENFAAAAGSNLLESDVAEGTARIEGDDHPISYGQTFNVTGPYLKANSLKLGTTPLAQIEEVSLVLDHTVHWYAKFPPLDRAAFEACGSWQGQAYVQDPHGNHWDRLIQVSWAVWRENGVWVPGPMMAYPDSRGGLEEPNFTVAVSPNGWVAVTLEDDWWQGTSDVGDHRVRFSSTCTSDEATFRVDEADGGFFMPGLGFWAVLGVLAVATYRRR